MATYAFAGQLRANTAKPGMKLEQIRKPWPLRDRFMLGMTIGYLVAITLLVSNIIPLRSVIQREAGASPVLSRALRDLEAVPYVGRVKAVLKMHNASDEAVVAKTDFLTASYLIVFACYGLATIATLIAFLAFGVSADPFTEMMIYFRTGLWLPVIVFAPLASIDSFFIYSSLHGIKYLAGEGNHPKTDCITTSNLCFGTTVFTSSASLLFTLYMVRFSVSAICAGYTVWRLRKH